MQTTRFAAAAAHEAADIRVSNANAALVAADAVERIAALFRTIAYETDTPEQPGDRNDQAFWGLAGMAELAAELASELRCKGHTYRKGLI
jgi:hypothetical protein